MAVSATLEVVMWRCLSSPLVSSGHHGAASKIGAAVRKMTTAKRTPAQTEVIQQWADMDSEGATFERGRMEANVQAICIQDPAGVPDSLKEATKGVKVKPSDVSYLVRVETNADARVPPPHARRRGGARRKRRRCTGRRRTSPP